MLANKTVWTSSPNISDFRRNLIGIRFSDSLRATLKATLTVSVLATSDEWRLGVSSLLLSSAPPCSWHQGMISTWTSTCSTQWLLNSAASRSSAPRYDSLKWSYCGLTRRPPDWDPRCPLNICWGKNSSASHKVFVFTAVFVLLSPSG